MYKLGFCIHGPNWCVCAPSPCKRIPADCGSAVCAVAFGTSSSLDRHQRRSRPT